MKTFICPYCFDEHTVDTYELRCSSNNVLGTNTCRKGVSKDDKGLVSQYSKAKCFRCQETRKRIYCNATKKEIPSDFLLGTGFPIALIGAKASGKSNYMAVLINEICKKMTSNFNCTLDISCSEESKRYYDEYYYSPVYEEGRAVNATDLGEPPLIFPLRFMDSRGRIKNVATLTFYDASGDSLDSVDDMDIYNRYIPNSKGIILFVDPLQIPSIRNQLQGKTPLTPIYTDAVEILSRVINYIRSVKNIKGAINIPLALVVPKMDVLEQFNIVPPNSCLREESEHLKRGRLVLSDFEKTNTEMLGILESWYGKEIVLMMKQFSKYSILGLSALGGVPNGNKLSTDEIHPRRVLDPLLWLLAENKYIKTIGRR